MNPPNPECRVCNNTHVILKVNTKKATLRDFLDKVIHGRDDDINIGEVIVEEGGRFEITFNLVIIILYHDFVKSNFLLTGLYMMLNMMTILMLLLSNFKLLMVN